MSSSHKRSADELNRLREICREQGVDVFVNTVTFSLASWHTVLNEQCLKGETVADMLRRELITKPEMINTTPDPVPPKLSSMANQKILDFHIGDDCETILAWWEDFNSILADSDQFEDLTIGELRKLVEDWADRDATNGALYDDKNSWIWTAILTCWKSFHDRRKHARDSFRAA